MADQSDFDSDPAVFSQLRIQAWPLSSAHNTYTGTLNAAMAKSARMMPFRTDRAAMVRAAYRPVDIVHIHWLERPFWAGGNGRSILRNTISAMMVTALMKLRGARIVWTAHDPVPHIMDGNRGLERGWTAHLWRFYRSAMIRMLDGVLLLSESHRAIVETAFPRLVHVPKAVTPHPHFRGHYPDAALRENARERVGIPPDALVFAFIGNLRSYKNPDGLAQAFHQTDLDAALLMVGQPETEALAQDIQARADSDRRIRFVPGFIADDEMAGWLRASSVCVFPYRHVTNSGSALLALSYHCPVMLPDEAIFRELQQVVGTDWVYIYSGHLTPQHLHDAAIWLRQERPASPDLSAFDWEPIARRTLEFFHALKHGGHNAPLS